MDVADVFRQGLGSVIHRPIQHLPRKPPPSSRDDPSESDGSSHRIAHTLTACCRCRQRKTRCDPTLPRCLPCERSNSTCEYFDTTKGRKISRFYVIKLQEKVRQLEAELAQYTEDNEFPRNNEDMVRPGGLVRLNETDETPRYLGPSSGIAMTRLLMEEAKLFTDSKRISELIPEVRARRQARMQSVVMQNSRKKSYPMISAHPAQNLPTRQITDKLVEVFCQRAQIFWPTLHEKVFARHLEEVYSGDPDPYKNFVVRMVLAISLQKFDPQYAGLGDSYYLAAMQYFEDVIRPKDLKTLQCLVLIGQYSLLTPTRTAVYYVIGLATRICQQEGLADEKTVTPLGDIDALTLDMRRRLAWIVASMEFGLAHSMGRPNGFSKGEDLMDVQYFTAVDDEYITEEGIQPGAPPSEKKMAAIHFFKMRMVQAEIRRTLYEKKRSEPRDESNPWFAKMDQMIQQWLDDSPKQPAWCKPWFTGRFHQMKIFLYRPSPQIPKPQSRAATICFDGAQYIIGLSKQQMATSAVDISWVFLLNLYMAMNTLLWTVSYAEVRQAHSREEVEELVNVTLDIIDQCTERWPGASAASQLYSIFSKACLQSYEAKDTPTITSSSTFGTPPSLADTNSPPSSEHSGPAAPGSMPPPPINQTGPPVFNINQPFGYGFEPQPETMNTYAAFDSSYPLPHPTFRSNSIFFNPGTNGPGGRRLSYFPPDFQEDSPLDDATPPATTTPGHVSSPPEHMTNQLPTPPESLIARNQSISQSSSTVSPPSMGGPTPTLSHASPNPIPAMPITPNAGMSPPRKVSMSSRAAAFTIPAVPQHHSGIQQRPLPPPTTVTDWFSPPPPFISPYSFSTMSNSFVNDATAGLTGFGGVSGLGLMQAGLGGPGMSGGPPGAGSEYQYLSQRHGSLSQEQQMELMDVLENEGMTGIDAFLNMGSAGLAGGGAAEGSVQWQS